MTKPVLFTHYLDLSVMAQAGGDEYFEVPERDRAAIAKAFSVDAIEDLAARLHVTRISTNEFAVAGNLKATVLQSCVVTLQPIRTRFDLDVSRHYRVVPPAWRRKEPSILDVTMDEEETETVPSSSVDVASPVLEELSLAIDPYLKAEGAEFESTENESLREESPFAVLKALKVRDEKT